MELLLKYVVLGVLSGLFSSTFGVGSGILIIPALVMIFGLAQKSAQGICLAVMVPMALVGAIRYKLMPDIPVDFKIVTILAISGVVGAWVGVELAVYTPGSILRKTFSVIMVVAAVKMFLK